MPRPLLAFASLATALALSLGISHAATAPAPGSPEYLQRDAQNILDAYGRQLAPDGQFSTRYIEAQNENVPQYLLDQLADQMRTPTRPVLTAGQWFPGWNQGNPYRLEWPGERGLEVPVAFTNRFGALLRGHVWAPLPGARDPYSGRKLRPPYPLVVITTGAVQGSGRMYTWLAHDLAERGYIVLTYDVQGQGTSETLPHEEQGPLGPDWAWCDFATPALADESTACPGVPFQQASTFIKGTEDALDFALSTPKRAYRNPQAGQAQVNSFNPLWKRIDRSRFRGSQAPGKRRKRIAIIGHSLGARAVSQVQGTDRRVSAVVALDKLHATGEDEELEPGDVASVPAVPALGVQSEYGFNVEPNLDAPDPMRERETGFEGWRKAGVDSMLIVPRASTHLEYTDISWVLPASRYGQDISSYYTQAWLDKYLKRKRSADRRLLAKRFRYLEPVGGDSWKPVRFSRNENLSFYFCSGWDFRTEHGKRARNLDPNGVGCRAR